MGQKIAPFSVCLNKWVSDATSRSETAAAEMLKKREAGLKGRIVLLFQPAEEGGGGGINFINLHVHVQLFGNQK